MVDQAVGGDGRARAQQHEVAWHQGACIKRRPLAVALGRCQRLQRGLERSDGVSGLGGLIPAQCGVDELDGQQDAKVSPVLDGALDDGRDPNHDGHGLVQHAQVDEPRRRRLLFKLVAAPFLEQRRGLVCAKSSCWRELLDLNIVVFAAGVDFLSLLLHDLSLQLVCGNVNHVCARVVRRPPAWTEAGRGRRRGRTTGRQREIL
mmetsp:Transcript_14680/g.43015  ORF Transcript_14680/g.43015 Transcript_14680/m.43015 type:complete len:204 (-) Transcript_14680:378-989(-)